MASTRRLRWTATALIPLAASASHVLADDGLPLPATSPAVRATPATAVATEPAPASVEGVYRIRGSDPSGSPVTGTLRLERRNGRLRYERRTRVGGGAKETLDVGAANESSGTLELVSDGQAGGLSALTPGALAAPGRIAYRATSQDVYVSDRERLVRRRNDDGIDLRVDGKEWFPELRAELAKARRSICIETYSWQGDVTGKSVGEVLAERARAGVEIRLLVDSVGVWGSGSTLLKNLQKTGCEVVVHNRLPEGFARSILAFAKGLFGGDAEGERRGIRNHDHRKVAIVDGRTGWVGGMNLADKYGFEWHDLQARVEGPVVEELTDAFLERWRRAGAPAPRDLARLRDDGESRPPLRARCDLDVLPAVPGVARPIRDAYVRELTNARERILVENPYFCDDEIVTLIQRRAREGIPTTVIVPDPEHQDSWEVAGALRFMEGEIVKSGVDLRHYRGRMTHGKVAVIDSRWVTIGSCNLDTLSLDHLAELNVATSSPEAAALFEERVFRPDLPNSDPVVPKRLPWWEKLRSGTLHFFRRFL